MERIALLIEKRLELYPLVYEVLAEVSMRTRRIEWGCSSDSITVGDLERFQDAYSQINAKVGVLFSSHSGHCSWKMREFVCTTLAQFQTVNGPSNVLDENTIGNLGALIRKLEVALKQDLGVFLEEFQEDRVDQPFETYGDLARFRESRSIS